MSLTLRHRALAAFAGTLVAGSAAAQASSSGRHQLHDPALACFGGTGSSASGATSFVVQPNSGAGGMSSPAFGAQPGFLEGNEPQYPDGPLIFGSTPGSGVAGAMLSVSGVHFDYLGAGVTVQVYVGGVRAAGVVVLSDTLLTCLAPTLPSGQHAIEVLTAFGSNVAGSAWIATPALVTSPLVVGGGSLVLSGHGPLGSSFLLLWSLQQQSVFLPKYGTLLVGPTFFVFGAALPYLPPDGKLELSVSIPDDPLLAGVQLHFQSLAMTPGGPSQLTNATTSLFHVPP